MRYILILVHCCLFLVPIQAQKNEIHAISFEMKYDTKYSRTLIPNKVSDYRFINGIPRFNNDFAIYSLVIDETQKANINNNLYLYVGVNEAKAEKYVIVDANNNWDLSDDIIYTFPLKAQNSDKEYMESLFPTIGINLLNNIADHNGYMIKATIDPYNLYKVKKGDAVFSEKEKALEVVFQIHNSVASKLVIDNKELSFVLLNARSGLVTSTNIKKNNPFYISEKNGNSFSHMGTKSIGDTIKAIGRKLYLKDAINNTLLLEDCGTYNDSSSVGAYLPSELYLKDVANNKTRHLNRLVEGKYVFIDFWGSWCAPCIKSLPHLLELQERIKNRDDVLLLGIARESEKDIEKLKGIIHKNNIEWLNVWGSHLEAKQQHSVFSKLKIFQFPTYVILDNTGKIVYRDISSNKTEDAINFFIDLIN